MTCTNYPESGPAPPPQQPVVEDGSDLKRSQRRSKVEALSKIDRAGTPTTVASGPTATSFVPPPPPPAGPSVQRNPLKRPRIVNPPFDLSSVRTEAPPDPGPSNEPRLFGIPTCPTYHPTPEEFTDPMAYMERIAPEAKKYGICKIVPPPGWHMPFELDTDVFRFTTRLQRLNSIEAASRAKVNFLEQLSMFHKQQGDANAYIPKVEHRLLDLWRLRKEVNKLGGIDEVNRLKAWPKITTELGFNTTSTAQVKSAYTRIVQPFEVWALNAKAYPESPATANGTPFPGSANGSANKSRMSGIKAASPPTPTVKKVKQQTLPVPNGTGAGPSNTNRRVTRSSPRSRMGAEKQSSPSKSAIQSQAHSEASGNAPSAPPTQTPIKITLNLSGLGAAKQNASSKQPSSFGSDSELSELSEPESSVAGSQSSTPEQPIKYEKGDVSMSMRTKLTLKVCEICSLGNNAPKILLCDGCDRGFHTFCLDPPLQDIPADEWYCTACLLGTGDDYGFDEGEEHSLPSFQARDTAFTEAWFNRYNPTYSPEGRFTRKIGNAVVSEADVEREFWRLVESQEDTVEVEYGADVHSTSHGSAAPTVETNPLSPYARSPWNLNNMPILRESLLRYIKSDISGMTVPWIYVGMLFSAFCWHNEDHYTYSVNYQFWGETKTWYGVPGHDADKFEAAMKSEAPDLFERQPSLLYQLVTMMNPGRVKEAGVDVYACDQRPNEFVITFPKAYHCGFNHGLNFNEAVNFALPDWLPDAKESVVRYKQHAKAPVFSHNELLITITLYSDTIKTAIWLLDSLKEMVAEETERRQNIRAALPGIAETLVEEDVPEEQYQCFVCKGFCYLSQMTCSCTPHVACLDHYDMLCQCPGTKRTLRKRFSEIHLDEILSTVASRAYVPSQWQERLQDVLDNPRPPIKRLQQLVADGDRVPHKLEGLDDLREFVTRANAWLERASAITTRKNVSRRRKGRQSEATPEDDGVDRSPAAINGLLVEAERLGFDAPEIAQLTEMVSSTENFQKEAAAILSKSDDELDHDQCRTALILGQSLNVELPEVAQISKIVSRLQWYHKVEEEVDDRMLQYSDIVKLLEEAEEYDVPSDHHGVVELRKREETGRIWKEKAEALLASPDISVDKISELIDVQDLTPIAGDLMRQLENIQKTVQNWESVAKLQLSPAGTIVGATRLCKQVKAAHGPLRRIHIPEVEKLQAELEFNAKWSEGLADLFDVPANKLNHTLNMLVNELEDHLDPSDDYPNDEHTCFCRGAVTAHMVTCPACYGEYHPKCVGINAKSASAIASASADFVCPMCQNLQYDDRPSLHALGMYADPAKWNFVIKPAEFALLERAMDVAVRYACLLVPFCDPQENSKPVRDLTLVSHLLRKLWVLNVRFDAVNSETNTMIVFEEWLYRRMRVALDAEHSTTSAPRTSVGGRTRARKPRFQLEGVKPHEFSCLCVVEPLDHLLKVQCAKCEQGYHLSCVKAPISQANAEKGGWRCPFCIVKSGKAPPRGLDIRIQMADKEGTDEYIDWRQSLFVYADEPIVCHLPPNPEAVTLYCTKYLPPSVPENFERPVWVEQEEAETKRKRRKTDPAPQAAQAAPLTPSSATTTSMGSRLAPPHGRAVTQPNTPATMPVANGSHAARPPPNGRVPSFTYSPHAPHDDVQHGPPANPVNGMFYQQPPPVSPYDPDHKPAFIRVPPSAPTGVPMYRTHPSGTPVLNGSPAPRSISPIPQARQPSRKPQWQLVPNPDLHRSPVKSPLKSPAKEDQPNGHSHASVPSPAVDPVVPSKRPLLAVDEPHSGPDAKRSAPSSPPASAAPAAPAAPAASVASPSAQSAAPVPPPAPLSGVGSV